jgi:hypothetical protein
MAKQKQKLPASAEEAKRVGYRIVSRAFCMASRIDRPDWIEHQRGNNSSDLYRRCYSKDVITVPVSWIKKLGPSHEGPDMFIPKDHP